MNDAEVNLERVKKQEPQTVVLHYPTHLLFHWCRNVRLQAYSMNAYLASNAISSTRFFQDYCGIQELRMMKFDTMTSLSVVMLHTCYNSKNVQTKSTDQGKRA